MNPTIMTEYYLHDGISFILELIMEMVYTIYIVSLIEAFCHFSDAVYGAIFSQEVFIVQFAFVHTFFFIFSQSYFWFLGEINVKTMIITRDMIA